MANAPAVPLQVVPGQLPAVLPAEEVGFGMVVHHCATRRVGSKLGWFPVDSLISILIDNLLLKGGDLNERVGEFPTILLQKFGNIPYKVRDDGQNQNMCSVFQAKSPLLEVSFIQVVLYPTPYLLGGGDRLTVPFVYYLLRN